jgi:hypothetical protein
MSGRRYCASPIYHHAKRREHRYTLQATFVPQKHSSDLICMCRDCFPEINSGQAVLRNDGEF